MHRAFIHTISALSVAILLTLGNVAGVSAGPIEPFSDIQASAVTVTPDPGGRSAVLEVDTAIDVACSVVYGVDETFGQIAVDNDMDGGAHADHHPVLGGLEPDTTYAYRLQGTAPDGSIYISEIMHFSTPAEPVGGPLNLALDATVLGASSEWSEAFAAENAFDGDATTEWSSRDDGNDAWVEIDLGSPQRIGGLEFRTRSMSDGSATTSTFTMTADGTPHGPFPADEHVERLDIEAQVVRFDVEASSGGNTGAIDILVLAAD